MVYEQRYVAIYQGTVIFAEALCIPDFEAVNVFFHLGLRLGPSSWLLIVAVTQTGLHWKRTTQPQLELKRLLRKLIWMCLARSNKINKKQTRGHFLRQSIPNKLTTA